MGLFHYLTRYRQFLEGGSEDSENWRNVSLNLAANPESRLINPFYDLLCQQESEAAEVLLTPDAAVRDADEVVLGLVVGGAHVVDLGVYADLLAAVKGLQEIDGAN